MGYLDTKSIHILRMVYAFKTCNYQRDDAVHVGANLFLELEYKDKELKKRDKIICDMQRRERELKDR